jgi:acyl-CoA reductase-like NAD-dependent aldehyde dehydrogenase
MFEIARTVDLLITSAGDCKRIVGETAGVMTKDIHKALQLAEGLEAGMVHVNDSSIDADACCPFGGWKNSSRGREGGRYSIEEYSEMKWVTIQNGPKAFPF